MLLLFTLALAIIKAWDNPAGRGLHAVVESRSLLQEGRYSYAVTLLEQTLPVYDSPQLRLNLSYAYLARGDVERAERQARAVVASARDGLLAAAWAQLGRTYAYARRGDDALYAWAKAVESATPYAGVEVVQSQARSARWHTAITYWRRGDWDAARLILEELLRGDDIYAQSASLKLAQLLAPADPERSLHLLSQLDETAPRLARGVLGTRYAIPNLRLLGLREGLAQEEISRTEVALRQAHREAEPLGELERWELWGGAYLQQGEPGLARRYLERALSLQPTSAEVHARLGIALLQLGDGEGALDHLHTALRLDPGQLLPHYVLAQLYTGRAEWERAEEEFRFLQSVDPDSVELHMLVAQYYILRGRYDDAEGQYIEAVRSQRTQSVLSGSVSRVDAALALARFYTDVRGLGCEKGLHTAREVLALQPNDPAAQDAVGWSLVLCRELPEALSFLESAVQAAPDVPRYRYHLARAYAQLGRYSDARDQYTWVRDLDPGGRWEQLALSELPTLPDE